MSRLALWAFLALVVASPLAGATEQTDEPPADEAAATDEAADAAEPSEPPADAAEPSEPPAEEEPQAAPKKGRVVRLAPPEPRWQGEKISLSLRDADLVEVLRSFAKIARVNLILDPKVTGKVTLEFHDVPWDQALVAILKTQGLGMEVSGGLWSIEPTEDDR